MITEGQLTEPGWFLGLGRAFEGRKIVVPKRLCGGPPARLVERAIRYRREAQRDGSWLDRDRIWCVADRDRWVGLDAIRREAGAKGIGFVLSVPCFEFWLLLHFEDCRRYLTPDELKRALRRHLPDYDKSIDFNRFKEHVGTAISRARRLDQSADRSADMPGSEVFQLVAAVRPGLDVDSRST